MHSVLFLSVFKQSCYVTTLVKTPPKYNFTKVRTHGVSQGVPYGRRAHSRFSQLL